MKNIAGKCLKCGGDPFKAMTADLLMIDNNPVRGEARHETAAPVAAGEVSRSHGATVAMAIRQATTQGFQLVAAYFPHGRQRQ